MSAGAAVAARGMRDRVANQGIVLHNRGASINLEVGIRSSVFARKGGAEGSKQHRRRSSLDIMRATPAATQHRKYGSVDLSRSGGAGGGVGAAGSAGLSTGNSQVPRHNAHLRKSSLDLLGVRQFQPSRTTPHTRKASWDSVLLRTGSIRGSAFDLLKAKQMSGGAQYDEREAISHAIQGDTINAYIEQATRAQPKEAKFSDKISSVEGGSIGDDDLLDQVMASEQQDSSPGGAAGPMADRERQQRRRKKKGLLRCDSLNFARLTGVMNTVASDEEADLAGPLEGRCIIIPGSEFRQCWDVTMIFCLLYTAIFTPFQIAFLQEYSLAQLTDCTMSPADCNAWVFFFITDRVCDTLFVLDIMINFRSAWQNEDPVTGRISLEYECLKASMGYIKSWLVLDIVSVLPFDLMELFLPAGGEGVSAGLLRIPKLIRLVRLMKLLKVVRASRILKRWEQSLILRIAYGAVRLLQFLVFTLFIIHWLGCGYYIVASYGSDGVFSWTNNVPSSVTNSRGEIYVLAVYWAIQTVTTVGYGDVGPVNTAEKIYVVAAMIMGVAIFSYVLGTMCTLLAGFKSAEADFQQKMDTMLTYLNSHKKRIPSPLRRRALDYCFYARESANSVFTEDDARNAREMLSEHLQLQVSQHIFSAELCNVPLFRETSSDFIGLLCLEMKIQICGHEEIICTHGEYGSRLYVLAAGSVQDNLGGFEYETFQQGHWWGVQHMLFKKSVWHRDVRTINRFCELHYLERDDLERTLMLCPNELDGPKKRIRSLFWRQFCKFTARNAGLVREYLQYFRRMQGKQFQRISNMLSEDYTKTLTQVLFDARSVTRSQLAIFDAPGLIRKSLFAFTEEVCDVLNDFRDEQDRRQNDGQQMQEHKVDLEHIIDDADEDTSKYDADSENDRPLHSTESESESSDEYGMDPFQAPTVQWAGGTAAAVSTGPKLSKRKGQKKTRRSASAPRGGRVRGQVPASWREAAKPPPQQRAVSAMKKRQLETQARIKAMASSPQIRAARARQALERAKRRASTGAAAAGRTISPTLARMQQDAAARGKFGRHGTKGRGRGRGGRGKKGRGRGGRGRGGRGAKGRIARGSRSAAEDDTARKEAAAQAAALARAVAEERRLRSENDSDSAGEDGAGGDAEHHRRVSSGVLELAQKLQELGEVDLDELADATNSRFGGGGASGVPHSGEGGDSGEIHWSPPHSSHGSKSSNEIKWSPPHSTHTSKSSNEIKWSPPHSTHTSKSSNEIKWSPPHSGDQTKQANAAAAQPGLTVEPRGDPSLLSVSGDDSLEYDDDIRQEVHRRSSPEPAPAPARPAPVPVPRVAISPKQHHRKHSSMGSMGAELDAMLAMTEGRSRNNSNDNHDDSDSDSAQSAGSGPQTGNHHRRNSSMGSIASMDSMDSVDIMARMQMVADGSLPARTRRDHHRRNSSLGSMGSIESLGSDGELQFMAKMQREAGISHSSSSSNNGDDDQENDNGPAGAVRRGSGTSRGSARDGSISPRFRLPEDVGAGAGVFRKGGIGTGGKAAPGFTPRYRSGNSRSGFRATGNVHDVYSEPGDMAEEPDTASRLHRKQESSGAMSDDFAQYMNSAASREKEREEAARRAAAVAAANAKEAAMRRAEAQAKRREEAAAEEEQRRREQRKALSPAASVAGRGSFSKPPPIRRMPSEPRSLRGGPNSPGFTSSNMRQGPHHRSSLTPNTPATPPHAAGIGVRNVGGSSTPPSTSISPLARQAAGTLIDRVNSGSLSPRSLGRRPAVGAASSGSSSPVSHGSDKTGKNSVQHGEQLETEDKAPSPNSTSTLPSAPSGAKNGPRSMSRPNSSRGGRVGREGRSRGGRGGRGRSAGGRGRGNSGRGVSRAARASSARGAKKEPRLSSTTNRSSTGGRGGRGISRTRSQRASPSQQPTGIRGGRRDGLGTAKSSPALVPAPSPAPALENVSSGNDSLAAQLAEAKAIKMAQFRAREIEIAKQMEAQRTAVGNRPTSAGPGGPGVRKPPSPAAGPGIGGGPALTRRVSIRGGRASNPVSPEVTQKVSPASGGASPPPINTARVPAMERLIGESVTSSLSSPPQKGSRPGTGSSNGGPGSPPVKILAVGAAGGPGGPAIKRMPSGGGPRTIRGRRPSSASASPKTSPVSGAAAIGSPDTGGSGANALVSALMGSLDDDLGTSNAGHDPDDSSVVSGSAADDDSDDADSAAIRASAVWETAPKAPPKGKRRVSIRGGRRSPRPSLT